jgi:hypothetical protein
MPTASPDWPASKPFMSPPNILLVMHARRRRFAMVTFVICFQIFNKY